MLGEFRQNPTHNTRGEEQSNKKIRSYGSTVLKKATVKMAEMRMCKHGGVAVNVAQISTSQDTGYPQLLDLLPKIAGETVSKNVEVPRLKFRTDTVETHLMLLRRQRLRASEAAYFISYNLLALFTDHSQMMLMDLLWCLFWM